MRKGFTLMEMLIVIAVIAILVAIAIPGFRGMQDQANKARAQAELKTIKTAVESFALNNAGAYPANVGAALTGATPKIVETLLYDPFGATSTSLYGYSTAGKYYVIYSAYPSGLTKTAYATGTIEGTATVYETNTGN